MAVVVDQAPSLIFAAANGSNQKTLTTLTALSVGDVVICCVANWENRGFNSATVGGQAMTQASLLNGSYADQAVYFRVITGDETGQDVVVTLSGADGNSAPIGVIVATGLASDQGTFSASRQISTAFASGASHTIGPVTPGAADNLIVGFCGDAGNRTWSDDAGWTKVTGSTVRYEMIYDIQTAADARSWTYTPDSDGAANLSIVAFNGESAGGGTLVKDIIGMGFLASPR